VIPLIQEESPLVPIPSFPWKLILRILSTLIGAGILGLYTFRYVREAWYRHLSRGNGVKAARALYRLLLLDLASEGFPLKHPSLTPLEFAETFRRDYSKNRKTSISVGVMTEENRKGEPGSTVPGRGLIPALERFSALYTELSYRSRIPENELKEKLEEMRNLYRSIRSGIQRKGVLPFLRRTLNLRGLGYAW
jgi:hypothetical protein